MPTRSVQRTRGGQTDVKATGDIMQDYTYSVFSIVAMLIHLIVNFDQLRGRGDSFANARRYRGFLMGVLVYYVSDGAWGVFAGLGWTSALYIDTVFFFLSLPVFVFMWCRFAIGYLKMGRRTSQVLLWSGYALLAANVVMLAANVFNGCIFHFDEKGTYLFGGGRNMLLVLVVAFTCLMSLCVFVKALGISGPARRRSMMVLLYCITTSVFLTLQIIWPLTPFTSLGCLIGNCFIHVFVVQDEKMAKHLGALERALKRARSAEKTRSLFFSIVSHDIRTPLNAILGYSELLRKGVENRAEMDEALESIQASGTTLLQLVNDVLDLAKLDAGKMVLQPRPVRLSRLTDEVFASFRMAAATKGLKLANRTADVPTVQLDELRFRQILFNLVGNAVKFTAHGSVSVAASYNDGKLEVSVADTGIGIPKEMLTRILDPFIQVQDPSHAPDRACGTGLGLSICRRLVEAMGGELVVESELGCGSTFRITIPGVVTGEIESQADVVRDVAVSPEKLPKRVMVVDDSPVNRSVLTAFLKKVGVAVVDHACDGAEALEALASAVKEGRPHDFVFTDYWMPHMNGLEFVARLRADPRFGELPVFVVTADTEFKRDARGGLFTGVLFKPLTYARLQEVLARNPVC